MKIGVFLCGEVAPELLPEHGPYSAMFESMFADFSKQIHLKFYDALLLQIPKDVDECDGYIISGSKFSVYDSEEWISALGDFVVKLFNENKKTLGICFGHQLIAHALGGEVIKSPKGWGVGVSIHQVVNKPLWFHGSDSNSDQLSLLVSHQDQVVSLPKDAQVIALSEFCPYSIIAIEPYFLGIQGHPEFSKSFSQGLMQHRRDDIGEIAYPKGMSSLSLPVNSKEIVQSIVNFLLSE